MTAFLIMLYKSRKLLLEKTVNHAEFATVFPKTQTSQQKLALVTASIRKQWARRLRAAGCGR